MSARSRTRFRCPHGQCAKMFEKNSQLQRHLRSHTGEKPWICVVCQRAFSERGNMVRHRKIHENTREYPCTDAGCTGVSFSRRAHLQNHIKTRHGNDEQLLELATQMNPQKEATTETKTKPRNAVGKKRKRRTSQKTKRRLAQDPSESDTDREGARSSKTRKRFHPTHVLRNSPLASSSMLTSPASFLFASSMPLMSSSSYASSSSLASSSSPPTPTSSNSSHTTPSFPGPMLLSPALLLSPAMPECVAVDEPVMSRMMSPPIPVDNFRVGSLSSPQWVLPSAVSVQEPRPR